MSRAKQERTEGDVELVCLMVSVVRRRGVAYVAERLDWRPQKVNKYRRGGWTRMYPDTARELVGFLVSEGVLPEGYERGDPLNPELRGIVAKERGAWEPRSDSPPRAEVLLEEVIKRAAKKGLSAAIGWGYCEAAKRGFTPDEYREIDSWRDDEIEDDPGYAESTGKAAR